MSKWHIADRYNDHYPACDPHGYKRDPLVLPVEDWVKRLRSEQCQRCAKARAGVIEQVRFVTNID